MAILSSACPPCAACARAAETAGKRVLAWFQQRPPPPLRRPPANRWGRQAAGTKRTTGKAQELGWLRQKRKERQERQERPEEARWRRAEHHQEVRQPAALNQREQKLREAGTSPPEGGGGRTT